MTGASSAQPSANPRRIAIVIPWHSMEQLRTNPLYRAFLDDLARLGFVEGQNLIVDRYAGAGKLDSYSELARTVVSKNPEAILTGAGPMTLALNQQPKASRSSRSSETPWSGDLRPVWRDRVQT
jgi:putative ABC transport system substrate-binding protein